MSTFTQKIFALFFLTTIAFSCSVEENDRTSKSANQTKLFDSINPSFGLGDDDGDICPCEKTRVSCLGSTYTALAACYQTCATSTANSSLFLRQECILTCGDAANQAQAACTDAYNLCMEDPLPSPTPTPMNSPTPSPTTSPTTTPAPSESPTATPTSSP